MERKIKAGIAVVLLALASSYASAATKSAWNGIDASGYDAGSSYKAVIKKNGKVVSGAVPTVTDVYGYYSVSAPIIGEDDLYSGGVSNDSVGSRVFQKVSASTNYTKAKEAKSSIYTYVLSNTTSAKAVYDITPASLANLMPGVTTNAKHTKAYIEAQASGVLSNVYLGVEKSAADQGGLLAKYVVVANRIIDRVVSDDVTKSYAKRLVSGVVSVYSTAKGELYIKTSGGIDRTKLEVAVNDREGNELFSFTGLTNANNALLKSKTDNLSDFYLSIGGLSMAKSFWYVPKATDSLSVEYVVESTVVAKQVEDIILTNSESQVKVPEPATLGLLAIGGLIAGRRFKK